MLSHLGESERVEADDGYIGEHPRYIKCPTGFTNPEETLFMQQRVRNRQETVNKHLKQFSILKQRFRHDMPKHGDVFRACAILVQLSINDGDKLFHCGYRTTERGGKEITRMMIRIMTKTAKVASAWKVKVGFSKYWY